MNTLLISMGSNDNSETNMELCRILLSKLFEPITYSETSITEPFGDHYQSRFLNQLALAQTHKNKEDVEKELKLLEIKLGRTVEDKSKGLIKIDVDLIKWNDTILKDEDWKRNYVADLLPSIFNDSSEL